jgi:hypothetical protein
MKVQVAVDPSWFGTILMYTVYSSLNFCFTYWSITFPPFISSLRDSLQCTTTFHIFHIFKEVKDFIITFLGFPPFGFCIAFLQFQLLNQSLARVK